MSIAISPFNNLGSYPYVAGDENGPEAFRNAIISSGWKPGDPIGPVLDPSGTTPLAGFNPAAAAGPGPQLFGPQDPGSGQSQAQQIIPELQQILSQLQNSSA